MANNTSLYGSNPPVPDPTPGNNTGLYGNGNSTPPSSPSNSTSLYSNPAAQPAISSGNTTSLYGGNAIVPDYTNNLVIRGNLAVNGGNITTTSQFATLFNTNAETLGIGGQSTNLTLGAITGTTFIRNDLTVGGDACINGDTITLRCDATSPGSALIQVNRGGGSEYPAQILWDEDYPVPVGSNPNGRWVSNAGITATGMTAGYVVIAPNDYDATITTEIASNQDLIFDSDTGLIQVIAPTVTFVAGATLLTNENNSRFNRLNVQSSTGNQSGLRVRAPNTTSSAFSVISAYNSSDLNNGSFINLRANKGGTDPLRVWTGKYTAGVLGPSGEKVTFIDNATAYAYVNPAGVIDNLDLATKLYVDEQSPSSKSYSINASATTGGANFNLVSSLGVIDTIKYANGTGVTIVRTDADTITWSIGQSVATTAEPTFAGATLGNIKVGVTTNNTIDTSSGGLTIAPATGIIGLSPNSYFEWAENSTRTNRLNFMSTNGNTTGIRVMSPNATTNATAVLSAFSTNDYDNGKFINLRANNSTGNAPLAITTGKYTAGTLGASGEVVSFIDNVTTYATVNPAGPTTSTDLITKGYYEAHPSNKLVNGSYEFVLESSGIVTLPGGGKLGDTYNNGIANAGLQAGAGGYTIINSHNTRNYVVVQESNGPIMGVNYGQQFSAANTRSVSGSYIVISKSATPRWAEIDPGVYWSGVDSSSTPFETLVDTVVDNSPSAGYITVTPQDSLTFAAYGSFNFGTPEYQWEFRQNGEVAFPNYTFPLADGLPSQLLKTNGAGQLTWSYDIDTTYTIDASSTTGGANLNLRGSDSTVDPVSFLGSNGATVTATTNSIITIDAVKYNINASATTGGANFNLTGSDSSTDTIKYNNGTGVTITRTDADTINFAIGQDVATTATPTFAGATLGNITVGVVDDNTIASNTGGISLQSGTGILTVNPALFIEWDENNDRTNRLNFVSSTGNTSGIRVMGPNATSSASANISAFSTNDFNNGSFVNFRANNGGTDPLRIFTGKYTAGVLGPSGTSLAFVDNTTTYATVNPAGPTDTTDLTTKTYVDNKTWDRLTNGSYEFVLESDGSVTSPGAYNLAQQTSFYYDENNNRLYRPEFQSTTGNSSGIRVLAPNYTSSASSTITSFNSDDSSNGMFTSIQARNTPTQKLRIATGAYSSNVLGPSGLSLYFVDGTDVSATINPAGPTVSTDLTTKTYVDNKTWDRLTNGSYTLVLNADGTVSFPNYKFPVADGTANYVLKTNGSGILSWAADNNTTYSINAGTATGGANLNLAASTGGTDTVKFANGSNVTVSRTDANTITISSTDTNTTYTYAAGSVSGGANLTLTGSDSTTNTVKLINGGHITATYTSGTQVTLGSDATTANSPNALVSRDTNGDFAAGTITANLAGSSYVLGSLQATTNAAYSFPAPNLNTINNNNGLDVASSMPAGTLGNASQQQFTTFYGDTFAGTNTSPALNFKIANGNSVTGGTVPFTGAAQTAPTAAVNTNVMGTVNFNGYATSGWADTIATQNQGGGVSAVSMIQMQGYATETFTDGTLTVVPTSVTRTTSLLASTTVTGTKGQIQFTANTPVVGHAVLVTGTNSGTSTGITAGTYYIVATSATTNATLSATPGGVPIDTTAGTTTGLTFARQFITVGYTALTYIPFGLSAKITVSGINGVTNGTYMAGGTSTTTSVNIGVSTTSVSLGATPTLTCPSVTAGGAALRVRAMPAATVANSGNRVNIIDHSAAAATYRANSFTFNTGAYGNTGVGVTGNNIIYNRVYGQWTYGTTITPAAANTAAVFPLGTADTNNIATVGSTSRLIVGAAGTYNIQFSVQLENTSGASDYVAYIWLRKNGTDVASSMGRVYVTRGDQTIAGWNYLVTPTLTTDYYEIAYAVNNTSLIFPTYAATAFGPITPTLITTITPVGA